MYHNVFYSIFVERKKNHHPLTLYTIYQPERVAYRDFFYSYSFSLEWKKKLTFLCIWEDKKNMFINFFLRKFFINFFFLEAFFCFRFFCLFEIMYHLEFFSIFYFIQLYLFVWFFFLGCRYNEFFYYFSFFFLIKQKKNL